MPLNAARAVGAPLFLSLMLMLLLTRGPLFAESGRLVLIDHVENFSGDDRIITTSVVIRSATLTKSYHSGNSSKAIIRCRQGW